MSEGIITDLAITRQWLGAASPDDPNRRVAGLAEATATIRLTGPPDEVIAAYRNGGRVSVALAKRGQTTTNPPPDWLVAAVPSPNDSSCFIAELAVRRSFEWVLWIAGLLLVLAIALFSARL